MAVCHVALGSEAETKTSPNEICHFHKQLTEIYLITDGDGVMRLNRAERTVSAGNVVVVPPKVCHTVRAGANGLDFLVITLPPYNPQDSYDVFDLAAIDGTFSETWICRWPEQEDKNEPLIEDIFSDPAFGLCYARLPQGWAIPGHQHACSEEFYFVISGSANISIDESEFDITPGALVVLPRGIRHGLRAGQSGVEYLVFAAPQTEESYPPIRRCAVPSQAFLS